MKKVLLYGLAFWAGGFVALYWVVSLATTVTRTDMLHMAIWPYHVVQYVWSLV